MVSTSINNPNHNVNLRMWSVTSTKWQGRIQTEIMKQNLAKVSVHVCKCASERMFFDVPVQLWTKRIVLHAVFILYKYACVSAVWLTWRMRNLNLTLALWHIQQLKCHKKSKQAHIWTSRKIKRYHQIGNSKKIYILYTLVSLWRTYWLARILTYVHSIQKVFG